MLLAGVSVHRRRSRQACNVLGNDLVTAPFRRAVNGWEVFPGAARNLPQPGDVLLRSAEAFRICAGAVDWANR